MNNLGKMFQIDTTLHLGHFATFAVKIDIIQLKPTIQPLPIVDFVVDYFLQLPISTVKSM